jgi:hypothetical protein
MLSTPYHNSYSPVDGKELERLFLIFKKKHKYVNNFFYVCDKIIAAKSKK